MDFKSDRLYILNKEFTEDENFYGNAFFGGDIKISGPTNQVSIDINGVTRSGTNITIPQSRNYFVDDFLLLLSQI